MFILLDERNSTIRLELKGPDNSLRLRQVRILGAAPLAPTSLGGSSSGAIPSTDIKHQHPASLIQHRNCEAETLRVFRLITSQVIFIYNFRFFNKMKNVCFKIFSFFFLKTMTWIAIVESYTPSVRKYGIYLRKNQIKLKLNIKKY